MFDGAKFGAGFGGNYGAGYGFGGNYGAGYGFGGSPCASAPVMAPAPCARYF